MGALHVMGVELPIVPDTLRVSFEGTGNARRNTAGWRVGDRRRLKQVFDFSLSPASLDETMLYRLLLQGEGEYWSMRTSAYGSKGLAVGGTGTYVNTGGGNPHFTNGVWKADTGETLTVEGNLYNQAPVGTGFGGRAGATLIGWRWDDDENDWRLFGFAWRAQDAAPTVKREALGVLGSSGSPQDFTGTESFSVASGGSPGSTSLLTITATGAGKAFWYSHLHLLPWYFPQAQVDQLLVGRSNVFYSPPELPRVYVTGDLLPTTQQVSPAGTSQVSLVCEGEVGAQPVTQAADGGVWSLLHSLDATLIEV